MSRADVLRPDNSENELRKMFAASLFLHTLLIIFFGVKFAFFQSEPINYQASVRVDLVGLPEKQIENVTPAPKPVAPVTLPTPPAPPTPKAETKPKPTPQPEAIDLSKKQKAAVDRLKALQALEDEMKKEQQKSQGQKKAAPIRGNILSAGTSLKGLNQLDFNTYIGDIDAHIKANWALPEWLAKSSLHAKIRVKLDENGNVKEKQMIESSGNNDFDGLAMAAVERSAPFPIPPEKFINIVGIDGIIFQFPK